MSKTCSETEANWYSKCSHCHENKTNKQANKQTLASFCSWKYRRRGIYHLLCPAAIWISPPIRWGLNKEARSSHNNDQTLQTAHPRVPHKDCRKTLTGEQNCLFLLGGCALPAHLLSETPASPALMSADLLSVLRNWYDIQAGPIWSQKLYKHTKSKNQIDKKKY